MILLFLIVFSFIVYSLIFSFKKTRTTLCVNVFCISCILVLLSFVVFIVKKKIGLYDIPLGVLFSIIIGPLVLLVLEKRIKELYKHIIVISFIEATGLVLFFVLKMFATVYVEPFNQLLTMLAILSCLGYGSYGYLYFIKKEMRFKNNEHVIFYIVLLFSCSFFFSIIFFNRTQNIFDSDYVFMIYSFCVVIIALMNELRERYHLEQAEVNQVDIVNLEPIVVCGVLDEYVVCKPIRVDLPQKIELKKEERLNISQILYTKVIESKLFLDAECTLLYVCKITSIEKSLLVNYFKQSESLTFKQYINRLKVEYAVSLIFEKEKDITVEELTFLCGFNTRISFYRAFVHVYGFAPSELLSE